MPIGDVTAGSIAGQVHFSGLGNGTDFDTLISKLVSAEQTRVTTYTTWKNSWLNKNVAFKDLNNSMLTLRTTLQGMDTIGEFLKKTADSSNTSSLVSTAGGTAETGTHTFSVKQLAQNKTMMLNSGVSSLTANINSLGTPTKFTYVYKGVTVSNAIPATATLADLANIINASGDNNGVRASTIFDGSKYYLQIRGLNTGAAASLTIAPSTTLSGFGAANFTTVQNNQDAQLKIDGWPLSNAYIARSNNSISDVITGLTLNLKSSGAGSIAVGTDTAAVIQNVRAFVAQINQVRSKIMALTKYDSTTKQGSILTGNYGLQMISTILNSVTSDPGVGFTNSRDKYASLSPLGLTTDASQGSPTEGLILLDEAVLAAALASNSAAVGAIFAATYEGETSTADTTYQSYIQGITKPGTYSVKYTVAGGKITSATINGHTATFSSNSSFLTGAAGQSEAGMVLRVNNLTDGTYSSTTYLKQGKSPELVDQLATLTNDTDGPLNILQKNYVTISDDIQKKIDSENKRISKMETDMRARFSKLDALLGTYSQQQTSLTSQIAQLTSK